MALPSEATQAAERLADSGVEVHLTALNRLRRPLTPRSLGSFFYNLPESLAALKRIAALSGASIIQTAGVHHFHAPIIAKKMQLPLVWQLHSNLVPRTLIRLAMPYIRKRSGAIMVNGADYESRFPGLSSSDEVIPFSAPIDTDKFALNASDRLTIRNKLGIPKEAFVVGTVGNFTWQKQHNLLIEAFCNWRKLRRGPSVLLILGSPVKSQASYYESEVVQLVRAKGLNNRDVMFLTPGQDVARYLNALDLFMLTSRAEGVPLALGEAMATELPVISTDAGAIGTIIKHGQNGILLKNNSAEDIARHVDALFLNTKIRLALSKAARRYCVAHMSIESAVNAHELAYIRAIGSKVAKNASHV